MKSQIQFDVEDAPEFRSREDYTSLGIQLCFNGDILTALQVVTEHEDKANRNEIVALARETIGPLLALVEFGKGVPLKLGMVHTPTVQSKSEDVATVTGSFGADSILFRHPIPLPPLKTVAELLAATETRLQLIWYNRAKESGWVVDKIRSYYAVLELEQETYKRASQSPKWQEMKWVRDAVSHPRLGNQTIKNYLRKQIQADHIEPGNELHSQFLRQKLQVLEDEARNILEQKVPKWW